MFGNNRDRTKIPADGRPSEAMTNVTQTQKVHEELKQTDSTVAKSVGPIEADVPLPTLPNTTEAEEPIVIANSVNFEGRLLTAEDGVLKVPPEARKLCALFDNGMWLVSPSHRRSPIVASVRLSAQRAGLLVNKPVYVTPDIILQAYSYADRHTSASRLDPNAARRRIVETLNKAVELGANDVHIESSGGRTRVEFRIEGALRLWESWTQQEGELFLSSVYSHSSGQSGATANWLEPQAAMLTQKSGPDSIQLPAGVISVRCQWVPLADGGRYLDMRLQYDAAHIFGENFIMADVDSLGFSQQQLRSIQRLRALPGGMRVISGPVNQGKTTTLRIMLNRRMAETNYQLNCLMIEDPAEGGVLGARQIGVSASVKDEQRERTFTEVMRCALRLDPDIVMLGETRDEQTARFAYRLSLTGRQVYTTLHVYSALAIPQRIRDLGVEPYLAYDPNLLRGLLCQRLLPGLCSHCRILLTDAVQSLGPAYQEVLRRVKAICVTVDHVRQQGFTHPIPERVAHPDLSTVYVANPEGCSHCYRGRSGRTVCAEVIETDPTLMQLLQNNRYGEAERYWLSPEGMGGTKMLWHAVDKIRRGDIAPDDAEFELGPLASPQEVNDIESRMEQPA